MWKRRRRFLRGWRLGRDVIEAIDVIGIMDETIEKIVGDAMKVIQDYSYSDQYFILEEVCNRLQHSAEEALKLEYFNPLNDDE